MATELKPVYLITGGDRPKIQRALRRLRDRIGEEGVELLSALESGGDDAVAACNSMGLLGGGRRLVVVEEVERWKAADVKAVAAYLASPAPDTVLALVAAELKKDSPLGKACAKSGDVLVFDVPKRRVPEWVTTQFKERGVTVDADAVRLLVEIVGEDPEELASSNMVATQLRIAMPDAAAVAGHEHADRGDERDGGEHAEVEPTSPSSGRGHRRAAERCRAVAGSSRSCPWSTTSWRSASTTAGSSSRHNDHRTALSLAVQLKVITCSRFSW